MTIYAPDLYARLRRVALLREQSHDARLRDALYLSALYATAKPMTTNLPASMVRGFYSVLSESKSEAVAARAHRVLGLIRKFAPDVPDVMGPYPVDIGMMLFVTAARALVFASRGKEHRARRDFMLEVADDLLTDSVILVIGDPMGEPSRSFETDLMLSAGDTHA